MISIKDYGATVSAADNTAAIQAAINAARVQNTSVWVPPGHFKHAGVLHVDGVEIYGSGTASVLQGTDRQSMALIVGGNGAKVHDLSLSGPDGSRYAAYETCGISVINATNFAIERVAIDHSGGAGIQISGSAFGSIKGSSFSNTGADSVHISNFAGPSHDIVVSGNRSDHSGDDGFAVVSYGTGKGLNYNVDIYGNVVQDQLWGRGYSVVGGHDVTIHDNYYDNNMAKFAGVYVASESAWGTLATYNVQVLHNTIKDAGGNHGAIQVFADSQTVHDIVIDGNQVDNARWASVMVNGGAPLYNVRVTNNASHGAADPKFLENLTATAIVQSNNKLLPSSAYPGDQILPDGSLKVPAPTTQSGASNVIGTGTDRLSLKIAEDAYKGDAQYVVLVDGKQVGGMLTAHAQHNLAQYDPIIIKGSWAAGDHTVAVKFLNDAYGGAAGADRNLYVEGVEYDGTIVSTGSKALWSNGAVSFTVHDTTAPSVDWAL